MAITAHRQALELGLRLGSDEETAQSHLNLGICLEMVAHWEESTRHANSALAIYDNMMHPDNQKLRFSGLASCQKFIRHDSDGEVEVLYKRKEQFHAAIENFEGAEIWSEAARSHNNLALVYSDQQQYARAYRHFRKADALLSRQSNKQAAAQVIISKAATEIAQGNFRDARDRLQHFSEANIIALGEPTLHALYFEQFGSGCCADRSTRPCTRPIS